MSTTRIPRKDSDHAIYLMQTSGYLKQRIENAIARNIVAGTTDNLIEAQFPPYMKLELRNNAASGGPVLYFCLAENDDGTCTADNGISVEADSSEVVMVKQLGDPVLLNFNVTNDDAAVDVPCEVVFPFNAERLGVLPAQVSEWESRAKAWFMKFEETQDPNKRTSTLVQEKNDLAEAFREFAEPVLNQIAGSPNITEADRAIFNIADASGSRSPRPVITSAPSADLSGMDGCEVMFVHKTQHTASRASMQPDADAVEVRWVLKDLDEPAPLSPEECPNQHVSTRARFSMAFGVANAGKRLYCYSRWINLSDPHKSGPYDQRQTIVLSD